MVLKNLLKESNPHKPDCPVLTPAATIRVLWEHVETSRGRGMGWREGCCASATQTQFLSLQVYQVNKEGGWMLEEGTAAQRGEGSCSRLENRSSGERDIYRRISQRSVIAFWCARTGMAAYSCVSLAMRFNKKDLIKYHFFFSGPIPNVLVVFHYCCILYAKLRSIFMKVFTEVLGV